MFDMFKGNTEEKKMIDQENRERNFIREQNTVTSNDDQTYIDHYAAKSDLIRWQQDLEDELEKLKHRLRSEVETPDGWKPKTMRVFNPELKIYVDKTIPPLANEHFIDYIEASIIPFISRSLINSKLDEKRILLMLRSTCDDIVDNMADNYDKFDIGFENNDLVLRMIKNVIMPNAYRSLDGWTLKTNSTMIKRSEVFNEQQNQQKKGLFGVFG